MRIELSLTLKERHLFLFDLSLENDGRLNDLFMDWFGSQDFVFLDDFSVNDRLDHFNFMFGDVFLDDRSSFDDSSLQLYFLSGGLCVRNRFNLGFNVTVIDQ